MEYTHTSLFTSAFASLSVAIAGFYAHLAPWLVLGLVLVFLDLRFGIKAARVRGEQIRTSRAWRRTLSKTIDYLGWVTVAELLSRTFGLAIGKPVVSMGVLFSSTVSSSRRASTTICSTRACRGGSTSGNSCADAPSSATLSKPPITKP